MWDLKYDTNTLNEVREGEIPYDIPYRWNLQGSETNELIYKTETDLQTPRRSLWLPGGGEKEERKE